MEMMEMWMMTNRTAESPAEEMGRRPGPRAFSSRGPVGGRRVAAAVAGVFNKIFF
jgi:hypothetical protein